MEQPCAARPALSQGHTLGRDGVPAGCQSPDKLKLLPLFPGSRSSPCGSAYPSTKSWQVLYLPATSSHGVKSSHVPAGEAPASITTQTHTPLHQNSSLGLPLGPGWQCRPPLDSWENGKTGRGRAFPLIIASAARRPPRCSSFPGLTSPQVTHRTAGKPAGDHTPTALPGPSFHGVHSWFPEKTSNLAPASISPPAHPSPTPGGAGSLGRPTVAAFIRTLPPTHLSSILTQAPAGPATQETRS